MTVLATLGVLAAVFTAIGLVALWNMRRRLRRLGVPADGDVWETLRRVPLGLVVALDLLDLGLDVLASPIAWFVLDRFGLGPLKKLAVTEALIPGTQLVPAMTLLWWLARRRAPSSPPARRRPTGRAEPA